MTKPKIVFALLLAVSVAVVLFAFYYRVMAGVLLHDANYETFQALSEDQRRGVLSSLRSVTTGYLGMLVATNLAWIAGAGYILSRSRGA